MADYACTHVDTTPSLQMNLLLMEFLSSGDKDEAVRCLRELEVPHFNHELVYEAIVMVLEKADSQVANMLCSLLQHMAAVTVLTTDQINQVCRRGGGLGLCLLKTSRKGRG